MLKWLITRKLAQFERAFDYDMSYARDILVADTGAMLAFAKLQGMSNYRKDVPLDVLFAAKLVGTLAEDCGPCTQLMVTMALQAGVEGKTLAAVVRGDDAAISEPVRLGVAFARATLAHAPEADELRDDIVKRWGPRALVSLAFGITLARVYPTIKYALGHGKACQRVVVGSEKIVPGAVPGSRAGTPSPAGPG